MSDSLHEVVQRVGRQRKYINPTVKNLDTGETFLASEIAARVPKPASPRLLERDQSTSETGFLAWRATWRATKRASLSEILFNPILPLIPSSITPNTITLVNHFCNWALLGVSMITYNYPGRERQLLVVGAIFNFMCMMLDCLDGMHARRTKQTSKLGELLDHYLDALHTPMVTGGAAVALGLPTWAVVGSLVLGVSVYNAQLVHYHYQRVFIETASVEGQVATSGLYLLVAYTTTLPVDDPLRVWVPQVIGVASVLVMTKMIFFYCARFREPEMSKFLQFCATLVIPTYLRLSGMVGVFPYVVVMSVVSFRITGSYVLHSILQVAYNGMDDDTVFWQVSWLYSHLVMDQLKMSVFYSRLLPYTGDFLHGVTVQDLLPYAMSIHFFIKNVIDVSRQLSRIKKMR